VAPARQAERAARAQAALGERLAVERDAGVGQAGVDIVEVIAGRDREGGRRGRAEEQHGDAGARAGEAAEQDDDREQHRPGRERRATQALPRREA
jgi:hypothetical protein